MLDYRNRLTYVNNNSENKIKINTVNLYFKTETPIIQERDKRFSLKGPIGLFVPCKQPDLINQPKTLSVQVKVPINISVLLDTGPSKRLRECTRIIFRDQ